MGLKCQKCKQQHITWLKNKDLKMSFSAIDLMVHVLKYLYGVKEKFFYTSNFFTRSEQLIGNKRFPMMDQCVICSGQIQKVNI